MAQVAHGTLALCLEASKPALHQPLPEGGEVHSRGELVGERQRTEGHDGGNKRLPGALSGAHVRPAARPQPRWRRAPPLAAGSPDGALGGLGEGHTTMLGGSPEPKLSFWLGPAEIDLYPGLRAPWRLVRRLQGSGQASTTTREWSATFRAQGPLSRATTTSSMRTPCSPGT